MLYEADGSLTSEWFVCLKTEHDYGKVFKRINFGITAYTRVIYINDDASKSVFSAPG